MSSISEIFDEKLSEIFKLFSFIGIYRPNLVPLSQKLFRIIFVEFFLLLMALFYLRIQSLLEFAEHSVVVFICYGVYIKLLVLTWRFDEVINILENVRELLVICNERNREFASLFQTRMSKIKKMLTIYCSSMISAVVLGAVVSLINAQKVPYKTHIRVYTPFSIHEQSFLYCLFAEFWIFIGCCLEAAIEIATVIPPVLLISLGSMFYDELGKMVKKIEVDLNIKKSQRNRLYYHVIEKNHEENVIMELKRCIEIHKTIKELLKKVQITAPPIIFAQIVTSSVIFCMLTFTISKVSMDIT